MRHLKIIQFFISVSVLTHLTSVSQAVELQELRWGLKNSGQTITNDVNPLQSYRLQGRAGQDIQISNLPLKTKAQKIKVAILDTGIDYAHPELSDLIYQNAKQCVTFNNYRKCIQDKGESEIESCRDQFLVADAETYPGDCLGWSVLDKDLKNTANNIIGSPDFIDPVGHGTHVAGIIASVTRDIQIIPVQVIGQAPNQPIKPYSLDLSPSENIRNGYVDQSNLSEHIARGIIYAMTAGAQVINLSLGWPESQDSDLMKEAIAEANRRGIIIVAAAGNDSTSSVLRPCQYKGVICVAAHRPDGSLASFSNYGSAVDLAAPGVEILSTIPLSKRSIRLPGYKGYDFLSGTSQATPYVTGAVAELLSRGIPSQQIYARLVLGSRAIQKETNVIQGPVNSQGQSVDSQTKYRKFLLAGLLDVKSALSVPEQILILPADKETQTINWDRQGLDLGFDFKLKNYWKASSADQISVEVTSTSSDRIYPVVTSIQGNQNLKSWASQEEKSFHVNLRIQDQKLAYLSRLPSELSYNVTVKVNGQVHRQFQIQAEVVVGVNKKMTDPEILKIPIIGKIPQGLSNSLVDEVYDNNQQFRDYLLIGADQKNKKAVQLGLTRFINGTYQIGAVQSYTFDGQFDLAVLQQKIRIDLDHDGQSEYVIRFLEFKDQMSKYYRQGGYTDHIYIFDQNMVLKKYFKLDDPRAIMPLKIQWMNVQNQLRPAWVGKGQEVRAKWDVTDLWNPKGASSIVTPIDIHFYYLDTEFKLAQVTTSEDQRIVDMLQSNLQQTQQGVVSVLIAKNLGSAMKPAYSNDFYFASIREGQLYSVKSIHNLSSQFRNLVDTFKESTFDLAQTQNEFSGTMWTGLDAHQTQRITLLDSKQSIILDRLISSSRSVFDAALFVRAGFLSAHRAGVFLMTNSEIEFHDMMSTQVATRSLDRYSFFGEQANIELQFPITVLDSSAQSEKLPALLKIGGSGISRGHKFILPIYSQQKLGSQIIAPAKLRLKADVGCRAVDAPVFLGEQLGYAMDFYCGDQMLRVLLKY